MGQTLVPSSFSFREPVDEAGLRTTRSGLCEDMKPTVNRISKARHEQSAAKYSPKELKGHFPLPQASHEFHLFAVYDPRTVSRAAPYESTRRLVDFKELITDPCLGPRPRSRASRSFTTSRIPAITAIMSRDSLLTLNSCRTAIFPPRVTYDLLTPSACRLVLANYA